jgi:hypothetical protein
MARKFHPDSGRRVTMQPVDQSGLNYDDAGNPAIAR